MKLIYFGAMIAALVATLLTNPVFFFWIVCWFGAIFGVSYLLSQKSQEPSNKQ